MLPRNKEYLESKSIKAIKNLLDKLGKRNMVGSRKKIIDCIMECKEDSMAGGGGSDSTDTIIYGGGVSHHKLNNQFRGWGFTFL